MNTDLSHGMQSLRRLERSTIEWANAAAASAHAFAVKLAQEAGVCRICLQKPRLPLTLNYGREYACTECLEGREII